MATSQQLRQAENVMTQALAGKGELPAITTIADTVRQYWPILCDMCGLQDSDFDLLIQALEIRFVTTMGEGVVLTDTDIRHNVEWFRERSITWTYAEDYAEFLVRQHWPPRVIQSLDTMTDTLLGLLHDPLQDGDWERRGLVIGHVQSGKTANYLGLVSKAADAGYKFIIVIAGIHNELRRQTQERVEEGFIGWDSETRKHIGVGVIHPSRPMPVTVTTRTSDFNRSLARQLGMKLNSLNKTFILVIKKNASTLSSLHDWLRQLNTPDGSEKITDIPMLMIDDEADNASVNTSKEDLDPTRINSEIRRILNLFRKRCYVGYTATPFANIFISPDVDDPRLGSDLFPEHFIYSLDAPSNYFGYERLFINETGKEQFIRSLADAAEWLPSGHKRDTPVYELPESLTRAIRLFLLSRAIRNVRRQETQHCSMLVNLSRFVDVQKQVRQLIDLYLGRLKKAVRYNYALPWHNAVKDPEIAQLHADFIQEYADHGDDWQTVLQQLSVAADAVKVALVNSRSDEKLLYSEYNRDGNAFTVIAIGGLSLSRGLTLEGLTISYIHRNTKMYDTLLQMGRWFGYRDGYDDLCRIFMSDESFDWYTHIAESTEELRQQVKRMRREGRKPGDFGLYVKAHPDTLTVTALNKMYRTKIQSFRTSYDGKLVETYILPESQVKTQTNAALMNTLFEQLQTEFIIRTEDRSYLFQGVTWDTVHSFVSDFQFHADLHEEMGRVALYIREIAVRSNNPLWDVCFFSPKQSEPPPGFMIGIQERSAGQSRPLTEAGWYTGNKNRFSGNSMFKVGLDPDQLALAQEIASTEGGGRDPIFRDYTNARARPLLLIHLLNIVEKSAAGTRELQSYIPAISLSFPNSQVFTTINCVVNSVWMQQMRETQDAIENEDDFDADQPLG